MKTLLVIAIYLAIVMYNLVGELRDINRAEGECIAALISEGVERSDIITQEGVCYEKRSN